MHTLHRTPFRTGIVAQALYAPDHIRADPERGIAGLIAAGGLAGPTVGNGPAIAHVDGRTGQIRWIDGAIDRPAGNLLGSFFAPGTWSGILPLDERGNVEIILDGAFDYRAAMALERALGGRRTEAESAMTAGTSIAATPSEINAFLMELLDDTVRFTMTAPTTAMARLRRLARPHTRLTAIRLAETRPVEASGRVDLARLLARTGTATPVPIL